MKNLFTTTLRINLDKLEGRKAWEHLQNRDRGKYRSYSDAVIAAVNGYFDREAKLAADPYLETREKEDVFLRQVLDTIKEGLKESGTGGLGALVALLQSGQPAQASVTDPMENEDLDKAMDFINSL
ncbi:adenylate cyclase [Porcincola intestinalis]|uniref:Adenylate cyclase n=1 Tax=Porcincola intestinalis TaxID=2606632 RepID=A0A6L5X3E7_9FIRM|nr:adenylate cyclase [Porcincola intestinalis]MSS14047.1 adenylate cyclase [Porcincola intestinalis]